MDKGSKYIDHNAEKMTPEKDQNCKEPTDIGDAGHKACKRIDYHGYGRGG